MASHAERLLHLGPTLPTMPALQIFPHHSGWRLSPTTCPFPSHPHRPCRSSSFLERISILPHRCRPLHALAGSLSYPGHHRRESVTCPALWLDCMLWLSSNYNHRPRTPVRIAALHSLAKMCGTHLSRTTPHHSTANGLVERLHRTLKAAIMCHADQQWTDVLPLFLLDIRTAFKEDLVIHSRARL